MNTGLPILRVENLTVALPAEADRPHAVEGLSVSVNKGEITALVGESGSGKSVTAFATMGLLPRRQLKIVSGSIVVNGEDVLSASPRRWRELRGARIGMIFQEPMTALHPTIRIGRQVEEVFRIHGRTRGGIKEEVAKLFKSVHLPDPDNIGSRFPHQLSGGQRQRVMIAMALALEPELLVADEPTTALDVTTQAQILRLIRELQVQRRMGVLLITHDFGVVADVADRVAVMQKGSLVEEGTVHEVLTKPRHDYTKRLLTAVPILETKAKPIRADAPVTLETKQVSKTYRLGGLVTKSRDIHALQPTDIEIRQGEIVGVVGESGSGKSTLARCIARFETPSGGKVALNGTEIAELSEGAFRPFRRDVQMIFQDPYRSLNPRRTVGQSIIEGPINFGVTRSLAIEEAGQLLKLVGLDLSAFDRYPHQFSGGQRQRISIARALAMKPMLLIADEAVSALDVSVQAQVLDLIEEVRQKYQLAILFVTHDLRVAAQICHRIVVMNGGSLVEQGPCETVFRSPSHAYTKALLDAAPGSRIAMWRPDAADIRQPAM
jgi:peptide/nickel transport system ATP-binding protein